MSWTAVQDVLYDWALSHSGLNVSTEQDKVFYANEKVMQPNATYITLNISNIIKETNDELRNINDTDFVVSTIRSFTLSVNCYGKAALDYAVNLQSSFGKIEVKELLNTQNISFVSVDPIIDISALMDTIIEKRYVFEAKFYIASNVSIVSDVIENVEMQGELADAEGNKKTINI
jgi:hypothetical protein